MDNQQGDVILFQSIDDGEIIVENGVVAMDGGLQTAAYLSLFGGNEDDDGLQGNVLGWWGNLNQEPESSKYVSRTQNIIDTIPATTSNLIKLQDAVKADLEWLLTDNIATSIDVEIRIPVLNRVDILINIVSIDLEQNLEFSANWKASI